MAHTPARKSSYLPIALAVLAAGTVAYFAFFRAKDAPAASTAEPAHLADPAAAEPVEGLSETPKDGRVEGAPEARSSLPPPKPESPKLEPPRTERRPLEPLKAESPAGVAKVNFEAPKLVPSEAPARGRVEGPSTEVDALVAEGKWREARAKLGPLFAAACSDAERAALAARGLEISQQLLTIKPDEKDLELYEIQQGDTLEGIARKFKALSGVKGAVMLLNNYRETSVLRVGRKVKVPRGTWSIVIDKSLFRLWVCYEGAPVKAYPVTVGAEGKPTPAAKYVVGTRNPKPAWWPPAETNIKDVPVKYGDPRNPLGDWWISLDHDLHHGIGIHGTNEPQSIGTRASNGCVRMLNEDVGEVAALSYKGMAVNVVE